MMSTTTLPPIMGYEWMLNNKSSLPESISRGNYIAAIPPQSFENSSSTLSYPIKGTDTITIGDQEKWVLVKKVLTFIRLPHQAITKSLLTRNPLIRLQEVAAGGTQAEFIEAIANIGDWQYPSYIKEAIELALKMGYYATATKLANDGVKLYPEDDQLQKYARVLAPPEVVKKGIPPKKGLRTSMKWLKAHASEYRGQWVVIQNGELLGHSRTRSDLTELLENIPVLDDIVVTKIPNFDIQF